MANYWINDKGFDIVYKFVSNLPNTIHIVIVGTNNNIDSILSKNIISIHRKNSQEELADIYSSSNLFVNPTRLDNFPTVNIEAIACECLY